MKQQRVRFKLVALLLFGLFFLLALAELGEREGGAGR